MTIFIIIVVISFCLAIQAERISLALCESQDMISLRADLIEDEMEDIQTLIAAAVAAAIAALPRQGSSLSASVADNKVVTQNDDDLIDLSSPIEATDQTICELSSREFTEIDTGTVRASIDTLAGYTSCESDGTDCVCEISYDLTDESVSTVSISTYGLTYVIADHCRSHLYNSELIGRVYARSNKHFLILGVDAEGRAIGSTISPVTGEIVGRTRARNVLARGVRMVSQPTHWDTRWAETSDESPSESPSETGLRLSGNPSVSDTQPVVVVVDETATVVRDSSGAIRWCYPTSKRGREIRSRLRWGSLGSPTVTTVGELKEGLESGRYL